MKQERSSGAVLATGDLTDEQHVVARDQSAVMLAFEPRDGAGD
jgi:hypothetical protein